MKRATIPGECYIAYEALVAGALFRAGMEREPEETGALRCLTCGEWKWEWLETNRKYGSCSYCTEKSGQHTWRVLVG